MYGIYTYIYHKNQPNVGKYTIHGSYGYCHGYKEHVCYVKFLNFDFLWTLVEDVFPCLFDLDTRNEDVNR